MKAAAWVRRYTSNLSEELNRANGFLAIGGVFLSLVGVVASGLLQLVLLATGGLIIATAVAPGLIRAIPAPLKPISDYVGQEVSIPTYSSISPIPPSIGILGVEGVGKTALKNYLLHHPQQQGSTQKITARITTTIENSSTYIAVIDGPGHSMAQQFEIASTAEVLIVLLDHNIVPGQTDTASSRIEHHQLFNRQLRDHLKNSWDRQKPATGAHIHLLMNKRDEWEQSSAADQALLIAELDSQKAAWESMRFVDCVVASPHANIYASDISVLATAVKQHLQSLRET